MASKLLMIPGPTEFSEAVYAALGEKTLSHVDPAFIERFGSTLDGLHALLGGSKRHFPLVMSAGGAIGWDVVGANVLAPGDAVVVVNSGYFGDRFGACLASYGAQVEHLRAEPGGYPSLAALEAALSGKAVRLVTLTHVDTSTGVLCDVAAYAALVKRVSPSTLVAVDGVCATGAEATPLDHIDVVLTGSQKALGAPPGLAILWISDAVLARRHEKGTCVGAYVDLLQWMPIMDAYRGRKPSYFSTPAVNSICALHASVTEILAYGYEAHLQAHASVAGRFKAAIRKAGLKTLPTAPELEAHTMTAIYLPDGVELPKLLAAVGGRGVVLAGGLLPELKTKYFRVGHMGYSVRSEGHGKSDVRTTLVAILDSLVDLGYSCDKNGALAVFDSAN